MKNKGREREKEDKIMECGNLNPKRPYVTYSSLSERIQSFIEVVSPTRFRHCRERWLTGNVRLLLIPLISLRYIQHAQKLRRSARK